MDACGGNRSPASAPSRKSIRHCCRIPKRIVEALIAEADGVDEDEDEEEGAEGSTESGGDDRSGTRRPSASRTVRNGPCSSASTRSRK